LSGALLYYQFFGFNAPPFNLTPDPRFMYLSRGHREALEHMIYGATERKGFVLVSGDIGMGKTTLTRVFLSRIADQAKTALIFNAFLDEVELLRALGEELELPESPGGRGEIIRRLNRFLLEEAGRGGNVVLILDEAQNLPAPVLEQVRMLSNLETDQQKLLQIVLVGQPEILPMLKRADLAQLNQRITVRYHLPRLTYEETVAYIGHRLEVAGAGNRARFHKRAFDSIHGYARGAPRRINAVCDRALLVAFTKDNLEVTRDCVLQAQGELEGGDAAPRRSAWRRIWPFGLTALSPKVGSMGGFFS
jgi:general secretion pathway protein A